MGRALSEASDAGAGFETGNSDDDAGNDAPRGYG